MLNSGWSRLVPNAGRVTMGKRVMSVASAPVARQVRYVVQESYDGTWFDVIPPVSSRAIADDAMGMMAKGVYRIKEV